MQMYGREHNKVYNKEHMGKINFANLLLFQTFHYFYRPVFLNCFLQTKWK